MKTVSKLSNRCLKVNEESETLDEANDAACIDSNEVFGLEKFSDIEVQKYGINDFVIITREFFLGK